MDDLDKPVISIPQPTWHYILASVALGSMSAYCAVIVVILLIYDPVWLMIIELSVLCPLPLIGLYFMLKRPIFKVAPDGMTVEKGWLRWDQVEYCYWGHHHPDVLNVKAHRALHFIRVPPSLRADVEKAIRAYGKWQTE